MNTASWRNGEIAVIGLRSSGQAVSRLLRSHGARVYASDAVDNAQTQNAAEAVRVAGGEAAVGLHDLGRIAQASLVVTSPGVPPDAPPIRAALDHGVPIVSEVEIALTAMPGVRYIAVTGTNGKSTVTSIIAHLLRAITGSAEAAGNIGRPLSEVALAPTKPTWIALEMSSYQLHDTPSLSPVVGVLTNLSPDHLDRYRNVEPYYADKMLLFRHATPESRWVVNYDDATVMDRVRGLAGYAFRFSAEGRLADAFLDRGHNQLILLDEPLMDRGGLPLLGSHNVGNALASALAVAVADEGYTSLEVRRRIADALRSVRPLPHRLESLGEIGGVLWVNDSKATNVSSARVGVDSMSRPTVLLLGGRHKGEAYTGLIEPIRRHCRAVLAFGEARELVQHDLSGTIPVQLVHGSFEEVVHRARELARPGDCVLLSPACSSFDMFANYEERGATFSRLAHGPKTGNPS